MQRFVVLTVVAIAAMMLVVLSPGSVSPARACSCASPSLEEAFAQSDAVFVGTLVEIRRPEVMLSSMDESRFVFDVETVYAGQVYDEQSIVTASDGASCGLELQVGVRAVVFGTTDEYEISPDPGEYGANLCNGTGPYSVVPASFGSGAPPLAGSSGIGADDGVASTAVRHWWWAASAIIAIVLVGVTLRRSARRSRNVGAPVQTAHSEPTGDRDT